MRDFNDGGPAFPFHENNNDGTHYHDHPGMTLRDFFAAKALAALITEPVSEAYESTVQYYSRGLTVKGPDAYAHVAYMMADAMLAERERTKDTQP